MPYNPGMPELPEVETIVRTFRRRLEGRRITRFVSHWKKHASPSFALVRRKLQGSTIRRLTRRGKNIVAELGDSGFLLVHLRMSGRLEWGPDCDSTPKHIRAYWELDGGERLLFCDARKFGRIVYTPDLGATTADLGPEPLDRGFTVNVLAAILQRRARPLKPLLLDQNVIAGLGNIYADESLFRAGLHPLTRADKLSLRRIQRLHEAIRFVLRKAIRHCGTSFDWAYLGGRMQDYLNVYGRTGQPCPVCQTPIERIVVAQRGTHMCPDCQKA